MKPTLAAAVCAACLLPVRAARAQSIVGEAVVTGGSSTDEVAIAAVQGRVFGEITSSIRFFGEASWAGRSTLTDGDHAEESDAFAGAYPYDNRVDVIEAYAEGMFRRGSALLGVRGGRFRTPFGIYNGSEHAYMGFIRAPLIRYADYPALSNTFLEHGADFIAGVPQLTVQATVGAPADVGEYVRGSGVDGIVRVQGYAGPFIAGASYIATSPTETTHPTPGRARFTGIDVRWMHAGIQLRGEWITGQPFEGTTTTGWYADLLLHRPAMGPVTALGRIEVLDHEGTGEQAAPSDTYLRRETIGARVRLTHALALSVNVIHQSGAEDEYPPNALDVGLTWSLRTR
jgi:hypothetical protein